MEFHVKLGWKSLQSSPGLLLLLLPLLQWSWTSSWAQEGSCRTLLWLNIPLSSCPAPSKSWWKGLFTSLRPETVMSEPALYFNSQLKAGDKKKQETTLQANKDMFRVDPHPPKKGDFPLWNVLGITHICFSQWRHIHSTYLHTPKFSTASNLCCSSDKPVARTMTPASVLWLFGDVSFSIS